MICLARQKFLQFCHLNIYCPLLQRFSPQQTLFIGGNGGRSSEADRLKNGSAHYPFLMCCEIGS